MSKPKSKRPVRENLEAFGIAILMAVLLKYFAIEAYQIPTSSMQPTMMGSSTAGVYDRIVVDKIRYEIVEPKRWDITVFRYPIAHNQNYVKRLVGMPGERLRIAGGNVYRIVGDNPGDPDHLEIVRKPASLQSGLWKDVFPARMILNGYPQILGTSFAGTLGSWSERDGVLTVKQRGETSVATLTYAGQGDGGFVNRVYDGYPTWIAQKMRNEPSPAFEGVQDARLGFTVTPKSSPKQLRSEIVVHHAGGRTLAFRVEITDGKGRIRVTVNGDEQAASAPFDAPLPAGVATRVVFAHVDDECIAWVDGTEMAKLDCARFKTIQALEPSISSRDGTVALSISAVGGAELQIEDLRLDRDIHYTPANAPGRTGIRVIDVPDGHYFMLGDNTLQSVDSRDWTAVTLGMTPDGELVDPKTHPEARKLRGNMRPTSLAEKPDPDENPVIVRSRGKVVLIDEVGEVWALDGRASFAANGMSWGPGSPWFEGEHGPWRPEETLVQFVPREHILGRALLTFWPLWSPFRFGFIR